MSKICENTYDFYILFETDDIVLVMLKVLKYLTYSLKIIRSVTSVQFQILNGTLSIRTLGRRSRILK